jgi:hypothetical protein
MSVTVYPLLMTSRALKPGGWVELIEIHVVPGSPDGTLPDNSQIMEFYNVLKPMAASVGFDLDVAQKYKSMLEEAGYEDVQETVYDLPLGPWSKDRRMNEVGRFQNFQLFGGLSSIGMAMLTRVGGWTQEKVEVFLAGVRREGYDKRIHLYYKL